jgi:hypothetical protein
MVELRMQNVQPLALLNSAQILIAMLPPISDLLQAVYADPDRLQLVIMPVDRLVFDAPFEIGRFRFLPAGALELKHLRPVKNETVSAGAYTGQRLREVKTAATGFDVDVLETVSLVAFTTSVDWAAFLDGDHEYDVDLLGRLSAEAERALDVIKFYRCRLDLPDTLPGRAGSWEPGRSWLGAMLYTPVDHESYLIAGAAVASAVVAGIGLDATPEQSIPLVDPVSGKVSAILVHGLSLLSDAMAAADETSKFIRMMSLLEYLANPGDYGNWKKIKGNIACHSASDSTAYHKIMQRLGELAGYKVAGVERGIRTLVVHHGRLLHQVMPEARSGGVCSSSCSPTRTMC